MIKKILAGMLLSSSLLMASNSVELNVNNDTLEVLGEYNLNEVYNLSNDANYNFTLSYINSQKSDSNKIVSAGLKILNPYINDIGLSVGFGAKLLWADNYTESFMAVPLNIFVKYEFNENINFNGNFSYSPSILSFSSADKYQEFQIKANYKVIDNGLIYIGKRDIKTDYTNGVSIKMDDSVFFGFKVIF